jgi:hypothetical protein
MSSYDNLLKMYADTGLRTAEDWLGVGREVKSEVKPRPRREATYQGSKVEFFSRDQTQPHRRPK